MADICIAGLWHQAVVTGACLSDAGHNVRMVGDDSAAAAALGRGEPPTFEPALREMLVRNIRARRLTFATDYKNALRNAEFGYISFDTPVDSEDSSDLSTIFEAARKVGRALEGPIIIVVTTQVPVGTTERLATSVRRECLYAGVEAAYVPEFLRLGAAVESFKEADRFVIGADSIEVAARVRKLYLPFQRPVVVTSVRTAEMAKHACNAFLATSISFINEIADLCAEFGADVLGVAEIMKLDRRIGRNAFLTPGVGFAGGTLGREVRALQDLGGKAGRATHMMDATWRVNQSRWRLVRRQLERHYGPLRGLKVAILGLAYKAGTDTLRRAISLDIIRDLVSSGVKVAAYDPLVRPGETELSNCEFARDPYEAAEMADALVLLMEWPNLRREMDLTRLGRAMRKPLVIDPRNIFGPHHMKKAGFTVLGDPACGFESRVG